MKTLYCDYFVPLKSSVDGDWWGVISITNHSSVEQIYFITIMSYDTGDIITKHDRILLPFSSYLISNTSPELSGITGRTRIYIDCDEKVMAKVGNSRGTDNAIVWENIQELPFPKP